MPMTAVYLDKEVPMFPLISLGIGFALIAPAIVHLLRDLPRIQILPTPWTPLPLWAISGYPRERQK